MDVLTMVHEQYPLAETVLIAIIILLITWAIERVVFHFINRIGHSSSNPFPASSIFANIARICIWLMGIAMLFRVCFNYDVTGFVAALGVGGIAISLGFQDTLLNLIGGLQVSLGKLVEPDEYIEVLGQRGRVVDVSWRHTTIVDSGGKEHLVPNSLMNKNSLVNIGESADVHVPFLVPADADLDAVSANIVGVLDEVLHDKLGASGVRVRFSGIDADGIKGNVVADILYRAGGAETIGDIILRAIAPLLNRTDAA